MAQLSNGHGQKIEVDLTVKQEELARRVARQELVKRIFIIVAALASVTSVVLMIMFLAAIRETQKAGDEQREQILIISKNLQSCIHPEGECYQRSLVDGQQRVDAVNDFTIAALQCVDQPGTQTVKEIEKCVKELTESN